jgi:hypothetical protein
VLHYLHHLLHPLKVFWDERIELFWPIWVSTTTLTVIVVMWVIPRGEKIPPDSRPSRRNEWSRKAILAVTFLALFLACYVAGSLVWEDFTYYDHSHFTDETLAGRDIPLQISPAVGRFWPLGYQEYNLLRHVTHTVTGYHALRIVQLLLLCGILLFLDEELSVEARVALILLLLITPSILISFSGLIYAEANIIFLLVCLAWSVQRYEQTRSIAWALAAVISSQFLLYFKETLFLLLLGFAAGRLLLRCRTGESAALDFERLRDPESRLDICLALLVVPFLGYYLAAMFPNFHTGYVDKFHLTLTQVLTAYFTLDLLVWIFVVVGLGRVFLILRRKVLPSLLWDGLALAGIAYLAGYLILRMASAYYLAPVDLIAVLYLGRLAFLSLQSLSPGVRLCALAVLTVVFFQDLSFSAFRMYEGKNVIHAKAEMGQAIKVRYENDSQNVKRLFFPFASPFMVLEFASYLNYQGVPVEKLTAGSAPTDGLKLVAKTMQKDGPCGYRAFLCHPGSAPEPGDLVVVFPDDFKSTDALNSYLQESSALLFSYDPRPSIPRWMQPFVNRLHAVSPIFSLAELPDSWLKASVSVSEVRTQ